MTTASKSDAQRSKAPIFVGGHHRSGTTLLRVMLNRHPHIACGPEGQLLDRTSFRDFHRFLETTWLPHLRAYSMDEQDIDRGVAAFIDEFFSRYAAERGKRRWAEKTPKNVLHIAYLFRLFPEARFIHMVRDPRDVHCSVVEKAHTTTPRWLGVTAEETARGWVRRVEIAGAWRGDERYLEIRYEDLVAVPREMMAHVLCFLAEPWDERILEAVPSAGGGEVRNVDRPVFGTSAGRWREDLAPAEVRTIEEIAGPTMLALGYAPDRENDEWRRAR